MSASDPAREAPETSPTEEQRKAAYELLDGPLSECCIHDKTSAYVKKYECFPEDWAGAMVGPGCYVTELARLLSRREAVAEERGVRRGLEAAAKWHEEQAHNAETCKTFSERSRQEQALFADGHRDDAAAIRALEVSRG